MHQVSFLQYHIFSFISCVYVWLISVNWIKLRLLCSFFFLMQGEPWLITYRKDVTHYWTKTQSFISLFRFYWPCTTFTTNSSCTGTWRHRIFFWTSTRWLSKLEILASPKSLSAKVKLIQWVDVLIVQHFPLLLFGRDFKQDVVSSFLW